MRFLCDDMFEGLARWLRAAGYDAACERGIADRELVRRARREERIILTADRRLAEWNVIRSGEARAVFLPHGMRNEEVLARTLAELHLPLRPARCMACGGALTEIPKESIRDRVPTRSYAAFRRFFRCGGCGRLFWHGSHWQRILEVLRRVAREAGVDAGIYEGEGDSHGSA